MAAQANRPPETTTAEDLRLVAATQRGGENWQRWGPYLSERQWGTVREDYSADGDAWNHFPFDHASARSYRWGEDGLLGFTDRECRLCLSFSFWNGKDDMLKERLFGLSNQAGNHGEDCKEVYDYLDAVPTYAYASALYKYPQAAFPYRALQEENARRGLEDREYELTDTGAFADNRYFDIQVEYAKAGPDDLLVRLTVTNRGPEAAELHVLPTLWFRNTWIWGCKHEGCTLKPRISRAADGRLEAEHESLGTFNLVAGPAPDGTSPPLIFTENESNAGRLWQGQSYTPYLKDAFHTYVVGGDATAVNPREVGTKAAAVYALSVEAGQAIRLRLRLTDGQPTDADPLGGSFDEMFDTRRREADTFYDARHPAGLPAEQRMIQRRAYAGLLWSKQFYHFSVSDWLRGDPDVAVAPPERHGHRNAGWPHLFNRDVISMPDKWEYPWYAAWDLAFHMAPMARIDPAFAKAQLLLFLREWYMHPNGQIPAYEWEFSDVNPPVHAWACRKVYDMTAPDGARDHPFLERAFHKLMLNFTWWVNRKDPEGNNLFSGGFLGMDNIGVFDRSSPLPTGGELAQADGTSWMAFYCLTMLSIALELARTNPVYSDVASKFFEHFVTITEAMNAFGGTGLWDENDGFYYDQLQVGDHREPLRIRSMVGLVPLFAVEALHEDALDALPGFKKRMDWFLTHRTELAQHISWMEGGADDARHRLLAVPSQARLKRVLAYMLDENEFLSPYGIRSLSRVHESEPYVFHVNGEARSVTYTPGESDTRLFGGNSNWRGPIWLPVNYLIVESLRKYHHFYGDGLRVECPTGSGHLMTLCEVADELSRRLLSLFECTPEGQRPCHGDDPYFRDDPAFDELHLFHEYFHADTGRGLGASHQTGWTALIATLLDDRTATCVGTER